MSKSAIQNFKRNFPYISEKMIQHKYNGPNDVLIILNDGTRLSYNDINNSFRILPKDSFNMTKQEYAKEYGIRLRNKMDLKHVTQEELSKRSGVLQPLISRYAQGKTMPSFQTADKIAKALDCSLDEFRYIDPNDK